jgi:hypothetical protein
MDGWPGEWWLDVRSSNVRKIMQQVRPPSD